MLKFTLTRYKTGSIISVVDDSRHLGSLTYTRKIHAYESDSDFKRLSTELQTYGDNAALAEFTRLQDEHLNELRKQRDQVKGEAE